MIAALDDHTHALPDALMQLGLDLSPAAQARLLGHLSLIAKWNRVYNLTAVRDPAEMFTHHLLDSLAVVPALVRHIRAARESVSDRLDGGDAAHSPSPEPPLSAEGQTPSGQPFHILDVGAGAGLPGVTLAIALPELLSTSGSPMGTAAVRVICVDAVAKKAGFIRQVGAELGLPHLQALHGRVESLQIPAMDVITCRAFASLSDIVRLTERHLAPNGVWMALKGVEPHAEMAELPPEVEVFHVEPLSVPQLNAQRCVVWMRRRIR